MSHLNWQKVKIFSAWAAMGGVLAGAFIYASANAWVPNGGTQSAAKDLGAVTVSEVKFSAGRVVLSEDEQRDIKNSVEEARKDGKIKEVKVIAWADREYPAEGVTATTESIQLADHRADRIRSFLKEHCAVDSVTVYNMAKRPNSVQELLNTSQSTVKENLEKGGNAPSRSETGFLGLKGKASSALVLVFLK